MNKNYNIHTVIKTMLLDLSTFALLVSNSSLLRVPRGNNMEIQPETDTLTREFVLPQISKSGSGDEKTMLRHHLRLL